MRMGDTAGRGAPRVALAVAAVGQLMVVLDSTIVNVALPSAQRELGFADPDRGWIISAYALAMGSLLLVGGRLSDQLGQRTVFLAGLIGFGLASAYGGFAADVAGLITARAAQGLFAALLAPSALSIVSTTFAAPEGRAKAFAVFGAVSGSGAALGLILGGVLTEAAGWRWCLLVNVPIAVSCAIAVLTALPAEKRTGVPLAYDIPSVVFVAAGMSSIIAGLHRFEIAGLNDILGAAGAVGGFALLLAFAVRQRSAKPALLPPHIVTDRLRATAFGSVGLCAFAMVSSTLFLTFEFQSTLGLGPLAAGLAFLPLTGGIMVGALMIGGRLAPRYGARSVVAFGATTAFIGMGLLWMLNDIQSYFAGILPGIAVLGVGLGAIFAVTTPLATGRVAVSEGGIASATLSSSQQLCAALGVATTSMFAAFSTDSRTTYAVAAVAFAMILGLSFRLPRSAGRSVA